MPPRPLADSEVSSVLREEMIVRVAFSDQPFPYVIPFGYVYLEPALYGITAPGRKTRVAEANPRVGFHVDSSARSGPWEWKSVTGEGTFELVASESERQKALSALEPLLAQAPQWWQDEIRPPLAAGMVKVWKITPSRVAGVHYARP